ncbi:hypothetical protein K2X92_02670, partial [Candidatus Gracilibacteria bacterium]|nr:hypothetical protein [Candidatus Gracilibacteria bacterium]
RGDAPLFARSGFFSGSTSTGGLYLANGITPSPWQKVLSVPTNHPEYLFINNGFNSQLQAITGGGNVGIGTTFPDSRFEIWTGASTAPLMHFRGTRNVALGLDALDINATGSITSSNNTAIGYSAGSNLTTGSNNIMLGADARAQSAASNGTMNIGNTIFATSLPAAFGGIAGNIGLGVVNPTQQLDISRSINIPATTGASTGVIYSNGNRFIHNYTRTQFPSTNLFIGLSAGNFTMGTGAGIDPIFYGTENLGIGSNSLFANTTGYSNTAIGLNTLAANTTGFSNMALGYAALASNTIGSSNTAVGRSALTLNSTGSNNTAIGFQSLQSNTIGSSNTAIGHSSLQANQGGTANTSVGYQSLLANTTGQFNTSVGYQSLHKNLATQSNTSVGYQALFNNVSGSNNTTIGVLAGANITSGSSNIVIGYNAQVPSAIAGSQLSIGNWIYGSGGNIGIATSNPGARLEVAGQIKITGGVPGNGKVLMSDATGLASWQTPSGAAAIPWAIAGNAGTDPLANFVGTTDSIPLVFRTNNVERMRMTSTGSLGIGTNNPSYRVDVNGDLIASGWIRTRNNQGWYSESYGGGIWMTDSTWVRVYNNKSFWTDSVIHSSSGITIGYAGTTPPVSGAIIAGNMAVGSNTVTAGARLDVNGAIRIAGGSPGNGKVLVSDATGLASWQALAGSSGALGNWSIVGNTGMVATTNFVGTIDTNPLVFRTNNVERLRINATDGNLSINGMILGRGTASILGNTVLGVSALNANVSGSNNTAIGYQSLQVITSGGSNTAIGYNAGNAITSGSNNIAIGNGAQVNSATASNQLSIGNWIYGSGGNIGIGIANPTAKLELTGQIKITGGVPGNGKVLISDATGLASWSNVPASLTEWSRSGNTISSTDFLGSLNSMDLVLKTNNIERVRVLQNGNVSLNNLILGRGGNGTQVSTTALGVSALLLNTTGISNTAIGNSALASVISGGFNTAMGHGALFATTGINNTAIGYNAGSAITSGSNNIAIGYAAVVPSATSSNQLSIGNWIYGVAGNIGIGTSTPGQKLTLSGGTIQIIDGNQGAGKYLKSDANGVASWQSATTGTGTYIYRMSAGDSTSSNTLGTVTALTSTPLPVGPYTFELIGKFQSAATANGIGITLANISATTTDFIGTVSAQLTTSSMFESSFVSAGTPVITTDVPVASTDYAILMKGTFNVTSTGTVAVQYRSENNGTQVRLQQGTVLILKSLDPALAGGGI